MTNSPELHVQPPHSFRYVAKGYGYAASARALGLSAPTGWQYYQVLERCHSVRLFEKTGRQLQAIDAFSRLYAVVGDVLESLVSACELVTGNMENPRPIALATGVGMLLEDLSKPQRVFHFQYCHRHLSRHGDNRRAEDLSVSREADLALSWEPSSDRKSMSFAYQPAYFVDGVVIAGR